MPQVPGLGIEKIIEAVQDRLKLITKNCFVIDEIQRLNRGQQDVLLPAMERGHLFIAYHRKPYFEVRGY